ncbi:MAG: ATP-binding cassette domain-containing protein [Gammaproteobacteria bacterium]|nr:ATP-binding cassette domain-containing protein [Gammaproteobacteria bacterium]
MNALDIKQLKKTYSNGKTALQGIDLQVKEGDFFALLGPNGAGKSTTIGIISSLVNKSAGEISVFDYNIDTRLSMAKACLGIVPQEINFSLFETTIEVVLNQAGYYGIPRKLAKIRAEKVFRELDLWDRRNDISRTLSGGFKRRLMIARALIHEPRLLILDEPTAGVDVELRRSMWDFLRQLNRSGTTIVLTTHYLEEAESLCENIAIIDNGQIIEHSSMKELLGKLNVETFIVELEDEVTDLQENKQYPLHQISANSIEVEVNKSQNINELIDYFSSNNIGVRSLRSKSNRLEELFIRLLSNNNSEEH